jgi:hypothetical protein
MMPGSLIRKWQMLNCIHASGVVSLAPSQLVVVEPPGPTRGGVVHASVGHTCERGSFARPGGRFSLSLFSSYR